ncbi:MAG TPA: hypothetical protein DIW30_02325 [Bacteroidales bacterium]|nr:hypothetical protein [Bacteroidales bacterium]
MQPSLFAEYANRVFPKLQRIITTVNEKRNANLTYYHKTMLRPEYSADQKWDSATVNTNFVAADMVAMDSPLPLKKRDRIQVASGVLPKVGMKKVMRETQLNALNIMIAQNAKFNDIAKRLVDDALACSVGIDEKNEYNFLKALSDGVILVEDADNTGVGLRVNFGFLDDNKFGVEDKDAISYDDIRRPIAKASDDGNAITRIAIALSTYNKLRQTQWAKELVANYRGLVFTDASNLPVPTAKAFDEAFADDNNGITFLKIDRPVRIEKNGVQTTVKPFNAKHIIYLTTEDLGALVWSTLVEARKYVDGVSYQTIDQYKLISRYRETDPFQEITAGQALVLPVLENVDQIYMLDLDDAEAVDEDAEKSDSTDQYITIKGNKYTKSAVIAALNAIEGVSVRANATDAAVIKAINKLSDEQEAGLMAAIASAKA